MAFRELQIIPDSNVIAAVYDEETQTLRLYFARNGRQGEYYGVPEKAVEGFSASGLSAWRFWRSEGVGRYPYQEV